MPTPREIPGAWPPAALGGVAPVARSVAEDLEAIFPHEPRTQAPSTLSLRTRRRRRDAAREGGGPVGYVRAVGALAAAALAGVSAGALLDRGTLSALSSWPQPYVEAKPAALPSPGPLPTGLLHAPPPRVAVVAAPPTAAPPPKVQKASAKRPVAVRRPAAATRRASCSGGDCRTPSVIEADARLRRAYNDARRAGVSSTVLTDYHDRWAALRQRAPREPRLVATRYDAMAGELDRMAARHADEQDRSRHGPWYNLRNQIAALWR